MFEVKYKRYYIEIGIVMVSDFNLAFQFHISNGDTFVYILLWQIKWRLKSIQKYLRSQKNEQIVGFYLLKCRLKV